MICVRCEQGDKLPADYCDSGPLADGGHILSCPQCTSCIRTELYPLHIKPLARAGRKALEDTTDDN